MELLVRMRNGLPDAFIRLTNSGAPGTGWPSCTRTPSMSVSQLSMTLRSFMRSSARSAAWGGTGVQRADVPVRQRTEGVAAGSAEALPDQGPDHRHEPRVGAGGGRPGEPEAQP